MMRLKFRQVLCFLKKNNDTSYLSIYSFRTILMRLLIWEYLVDGVTFQQGFITTLLPEWTPSLAVLVCHSPNYRSHFLTIMERIDYRKFCQLTPSSFLLCTNRSLNQWYFFLNSIWLTPIEENSCHNCVARSLMLTMNNNKPLMNSFSS